MVMMFQRRQNLMWEDIDVDPYRGNTLEKERGRGIFPWAKAVEDVGLPGAFKAYDCGLVATDL